MSEEDPRKICRNVLRKGGESLSKTIMDYYLNYGQNRDIEKYFRLRAGGSTRSSSEGSINILPEQLNHSVAKHLGKSYDSVAHNHNSNSMDRTEHRKKSINESFGSTKSDKSRSSKKSKSPKTSIVPASEEDTSKNIRISLKKNESGEDKNKQFNFNLESSIEIIMPSQEYANQPVSPSKSPHTRKESTRHSQQSAGRNIYLHSMETQTTSKSPEPEELIQPVVQNTHRASNPHCEQAENISPSESLKSNRQKLEWDSLGDIGYNKEKFFFCGASELSESERKSLLDYFEARGINFDRSNVVVLKNNTNKVSQSTSTEKLDAIDYSKELDKIKKTGAIPKQTTARTKEKWQNAYKRFTEKYKCENNTIQEISIGSIPDPKVHSTPYDPSTSRSISVAVVPAQPSEVFVQVPGVPKSYETVASDGIFNRGMRLSATSGTSNFEKGTQTTSAEIASTSIQAEIAAQHNDGKRHASTEIGKHSFDRSSKAFAEYISGTVDTDGEVIDLETEDNGTLANSFEFLPGPSKGPDNKENVQPPFVQRKRPKTSLKFDNLVTGKEQRRSTKSANGHTSSSLQSMHSTKSDSNITCKQSFDDELRAAIQLMSSLLNASSMTTELKKSLINKIITKIVKVRLQTCSSSSSNEHSRKTMNYDTVPGGSRLNKHSERRQQTSNEYDAVAVEKSPEKVNLKYQSSNVSKDFSTGKSSITSVSHLDIGSSKSVTAGPSKSKTISIGTSTKGASTSAAVVSNMKSTSGDIASNSKSSSGEIMSHSKSTSDDIVSKERAISRESAIKDALQPITHSEIDYDMHNRQKRNSANRKIPANINDQDKINIARKERCTQIKWIEKEIKHLAELKKILQDVGSCDSSVEKIYENIVPSKQHGSTMSTVNTSAKDESSIRDRNSEEWDSHNNLKTDFNNERRSKLQTPLSPNASSDSSIVNFISDRKEQFVQLYDKNHGRFYSVDHIEENGENMYTKPYSSARTSGQSYGKANRQSQSKPTRPSYTVDNQQKKYGETNHRSSKSLKNNSREKESTSISAASDAFLSSNSISIPLMQNTMTNTTTHQYDMKDSVLFSNSNQRVGATQTTESLRKSKPFSYQANQNIKTRMVDACRSNKQQQATPTPVAYTLTFNNAPKYKNNVNEINRLKKINMESSQTRKESIDNQQCEDSSSSPSVSLSSDEQVALIQHLQENRPSVFNNIEDRNKCIAQLKKMR